MKWRLDATTCLLGVASSIALVAACRIERDRDPGDTLHPAGYATPASPEFHGTSLALQGYPLGKCRECHGDDYGGGETGSSCTSKACHASGVEACDTCHGSPPLTGSHPAHFGDCVSCHETRSDARSKAHPNGVVEVELRELATENGRKPRYDESTRGCEDVYCHGGAEVVWGGPPLTCNGCHENPPANHTRFADSSSDCATCHGGEAAHIDGKLDVLEIGCASCHGQGPLGAPPRGLDGSLSGGAVGAHRRHLDGTISDRIGKAVACEACHVVPQATNDAGHLDGLAPADVKLGIHESYVETTRTCVVGCHWNREPGPAWDDAPTGPLACDGCHAMPPATTRLGGPHPPSPPDPSICVECHAFEPSTHVDGTVDLLW